MQKPPTKKIVHTDSVKTTMRIPRPLHVALQDAADSEARSLNAEILIRLQASTDDTAKVRHAEVLSMLQRLLDRE